MNCPMDIKAGDLEAIEEEATFVRFFSNYAKEVLGQARLFPRLSQPRIVEAHGAWCSDLKRVGDHEPKSMMVSTISNAPVIWLSGFAA
jgi:hypothetical protein